MKMAQAVAMGEAVKMIMAKPMKAKAGFRIAMDTKPLREVFNEFTSQREKLAVKHGTADPMTGQIQITPEKAGAFVDELNELLDSEIPHIDFKIRLADIEDLELPAQLVADLAPHITVTEP